MSRGPVALAIACLLLLLAIGCSTGSKSNTPSSVGGGGTGGSAGVGGSGGTGVAGGSSGSSTPTVVSTAFATDRLSSASDFFGVRVDSNAAAALTPGSPFRAPAPTIGAAVFGTMLAVSSNSALGIGGAAHVTTYRVDTNGVPTQLADKVVVVGGEITFSPDGKFLYLSALGRTHGYTVDATTGDIAEIVGSPSQTGYNGAFNPRVSPDGKTYCVASSTIASHNAVYCYARDTSTGVINSNTEFAPSTESNAIAAFAITPDSRWEISVSSSNHLEAGELSSTGSRISLQGTGSQPTGLAISADGTLVVTPNSGSDDLSVYRFDTGTGRLLLIGSPIALGTPGNKVAFSSDGRYLYVTTSNTVVAFAVNSSGGTLAQLKSSPLSTGPAPSIVAAF